MNINRKRGFFESGRVLFLPLDNISPNPHQPRQIFSPEGLEELAQSIQTHGILQPLSVRRLSSGRYQLISGERRLRAAKLAKLREVPCIVVAVDEEESSLLALIENLQRRDLDFLEEAQALRTLMDTYRFSQEEAAKKLGKSQSAVANKLRILKLPPDLLDKLRQEGLTERHARALLRLPSPEQQREAAEEVIRQKLTVAKTEALVEALLSRQQTEQTGRSKPRYKIRDLRIFLNTIDKSLEVLRRSGLEPTWEKQQREEGMVVTIVIPNKR